MLLGGSNIAELKALIGFAGPRVIEQTVRENCRRFQRSEFPIEQKGAIDYDRPSSGMRLKLASILAKLMNLPAPNPEAPREGVVVPRYRIRTRGLIIDKGLPFAISPQRISADTMIIKRTPQAASPLASWLSYLENLQ